MKKSIRSGAARLDIFALQEEIAGAVQIAAVAIGHHATLATRNVRDFEESGVDVTNPWTYRGQDGHHALIASDP